MILESAAAPPFMMNGYVLGCERTREAVYIDPGAEVATLLAFVAAERLQVKAVLLTHAHLDHVAGVGRAKRALGSPIWVHEDDLFLYERAEASGRMYGLQVEQPPPPDRFYVGDGAWGTFGDYRVSVHHTPGHCPGGVCLAVSPTNPEASTPPRLFVGDTLFAGSIGRTDLPGGDYETLMQSITTVLFAFGDDAKVFSGHGPETTIGRERRSNPFVLEYLATR
jgi:glyoxylase-like metal-dependent hydrolase (beta-lactamase superfamily II)